MRRSDQIKVLAHKFLNIYYMKCPDKKVSFLTIFEKYREFISRNAIGYGLEGKDFQKEILEHFPDAKLDSNHNIIGISDLVRAKAPEPDPIIKKISAVLARMIDESVGARLYGFDAAMLANFNPDEPLPLEKVEKYLQESESVYWQKGRWHVESRGRY